MWHASFIILQHHLLLHVTRLWTTCEMALSSYYMWHASFMTLWWCCYMWHVSGLHAKWRFHVIICDTPLWVYVTWLFVMLVYMCLDYMRIWCSYMWYYVICDTTLGYMWNGSSIFLYKWHDSWLYVKWLFHFLACDVIKKHVTCNKTEEPFHIEPRVVSLI